MQFARGVGGGGTPAADVVGGYPYTFTFVDGATDNGELQAAIDALPPNVTLLINSVGTYYLQKPLRLTNGQKIKGLGQDATILLKEPFWYSGDTVILGPIQDAHPHGDAILDDADFSYVFTQNTPPTELNPNYWMVPGVYGLYPRGWTQLNLQMDVVINDNADEGTFFSIHGETNSHGVTHNILDISWKFTLDKLLVTFWTSATGVQLESTTDFSASMGVRHKVELDWNGTTAKLLVDGTVEATAAIGGTFGNDGKHATLGTYTNQTATIGGRYVKFGQEQWFASAEFDLGGFYLGDTSKHQANYTVDWNIPPTTDAHFMIICTDDREEDDLIKVVAEGGTTWMQTRRAPEFTSAGGDIGISHMTLGAGGAAAAGTSVGVFHTTLARVEELETHNECLVRCWGSNTFYSTYRNLFGTSGQRYGALFNGGLVHHEGLMKFSGSDIGVVLLNGGGEADLFHTYDYRDVGIWVDSWCGSIGALLASDEDLAPGIDPLHGMVYLGTDGLSSSLTIHWLDINVISSDVTIPINIIRNRDGGLRITGASPIMPGATTPPAHFIVFKNPTVTDPIYVDMEMTDDVPIANLPYKVITPDGPAGRVTLTDADHSLNPRTAREYDRTGVTLTAPRVDTLPAELDTGIPVKDGTVVEYFANPTFGGHTLTVDNHDGTDLHVFSAAGSRRFRFSRTTGNWSRMEAA